MLTFSRQPLAGLWTWPVRILTSTIFTPGSTLRMTIQSLRILISEWWCRFRTLSTSLSQIWTTRSEICCTRKVMSSSRERKQISGRTSNIFFWEISFWRIQNIRSSGWASSWPGNWESRRRKTRSSGSGKISFLLIAGTFFLLMKRLFCSLAFLG